MKQIVKSIMLFILGTITAYAGQVQGIGGLADTITDGPMSFASDFISAGCYIIGGSFVFASVIKYFEHRRSPLLVPISTVIFMLLAGLALILLPFLGRLTGVIID